MACATFAALAIGHLNLVSVAFAVLFIGLGVDFGIHFVMRVQELLRGDAAPADAIEDAGRSVGASLVICAGTTSLAFFAFVPTDFLGVAELGLIAGAGMLISLVMNLTLLPALLAFGGTAPGRRFGEGPPRVRAGARRAVVLVAVGAAVAAIPFLPRLRFDTNPLGVRDPAAESVQAFEALLAEGQAFPWNLNALLPDAAAAERTAEALRGEATVDQAIWLGDFVPTGQDEKLLLIEDAAFMMGPALDVTPAPPPTAAEERASLAALRERAAASGGVEARHLADTLGTLLDAGEAGLAALRGVWVDPMRRDLDFVRTLLAASPLAVDDLPETIRAQRIAPDGRYRVEVFPAEDLSDARALAAFVDAVARAAPDAFGEGLVIHESGKIVVDAFQRALLIAACGVLLLLALLWRNAVDTALVAVPIALAALLCAAGTALLGIPLNYANVIVIPLLVGMGVDSGIHMVHRLRYGGDADGLLRTSTARAVVLSALTTLASFGTLAFTPHRGMASLGQLLALGIAMILIANLAVLPALARWWGRAESG